MEAEEASKAAEEAALPRPGPPSPPPPPPPPRPGGVNRGLSVGDLILRILAGAGTLGSGVSMATTNQTLPLFTQLIRYQAQFSDLPAFTFFVVANGVVCGYLLLSLPLSVFHIIRNQTVGTRLLLLILDTVAVVLLTAGGAAAAAIVYLAHKGNTSANWGAICQQYNSFCGRISGSLIGSFLGVIVMILLIIFSALVLSKCSRSF